MRMPFWLLRLLPMWDYICPKCKREVAKNSHECSHCGERFPLPVRVPPRVLKDPTALEEYVHKHIFPKVSRAHRDYLAQFFTTIFEDGFESGDFSAWTGTDGTISVETTDPYLGTRYAQHTSSSTNSVSECYKSVSNQVEAYMRLYLKFPTVFTGASADGWETGPRLTITGVVGAQAKCKYDGSNYYWGVEVYESSGWQTYWGSAFTLQSKYYCIELYFKVGQSDGAVALWVDGVQQVNETGLDTNDYGDYITRARDRIQRRTGSDAASLVYTDCVVVADAYIGPEEGTLVEVADSLELAETVLRNKTLILSDSLGLADSLYGNKSLLLSDSASLSELVTVIIGEVMKYVTDSVSSADLVSTPSRVLRTLEAIGATDNVVVNKVLQITETVSLAEIVEVGVGGVKKTRLFLILGDLAVQLTGD
jgi:DNA-directed RNA polymerase subunit RPC12/RpoP